MGNHGLAQWMITRRQGCQACQARAFEKHAKYGHGSFRTRDPLPKNENVNDYQVPANLPIFVVGTAPSRYPLG
jgi:hypothetical protein